MYVIIDFEMVSFDVLGDFQSVLDEYVGSMFIYLWLEIFEQFVVYQFDYGMGSFEVIWVLNQIFVWVDVYFVYDQQMILGWFVFKLFVWMNWQQGGGMWV